MDRARSQSSAAVRSYERIIGRRLRAANWAAGARTAGIQVTWLVIVVAGAAIPLVELFDGWDRASPVLGFVIVIAAGVERIFGRTTEPAVALDVLRRQLAREGRLLHALADDYAATADPFALYVQRTDQHLQRYDEEMVAYNTSLLRNTR